MSVTKTPKEYLELYAEVLTHLQIPQPKLALSKHTKKYEVRARWPCGYTVHAYAEKPAKAAEKILEILLWRAETGRELPRGIE